MVKRFTAIPLALTIVLGAPAVTFAMDEDTTGRTEVKDQSTMGGGGGTRADAAIKPEVGTQVADLPAGHWATHATQVAVANDILPLEGGVFNGQRTLTIDEYRHALDVMASTAEAIEGKGALADLRAAISAKPSHEGTISRLELAQSLSRFLDAAKTHDLLAIGAPKQDATRLKDLGATVPPSVVSVVDQYKVMTGFPDGSFKPSGTVTRYQMAAIANHIVDMMRQSTIAQLPVIVQPEAPTVVVVPQTPTTEEALPEAPYSRPNFRQRAPIALSWQALNTDNLNGAANPFNVVPIQGMVTGYTGPLMLQYVGNFRYDVFQTNLLDNEFRVGFSGLKFGPLQLIPYVGANVGIGASVPGGTTQYDTYVGATYGGIVSWLPMSNLELWGGVGQQALLASGRWNQNFTPLNYPSALGTFLTNYGVGLDFYVQPNIALLLGFNSWGQPADLRSATSNFSGATLQTMGGNIGVGFRF